MKMSKKKVKSSWSSQRTQRFLRKFISALESMPRKELIQGRMRNVDTGQVCSLGLMIETLPARHVLEYAGVPKLAKALHISHFVISALTWTNDYGGVTRRIVRDETLLLENETCVQRWQRMYQWATERLI